MTQLGVFRDDFYNSASALTQAQSAAISAATPVTLTAAQLAGAKNVLVVGSGQTAAQAWTTDTAANIITQLKTVNDTALAVVLAASGGSLTAAAGKPAGGTPNLFNLTYLLSVVNLNTSAGVITLTGGTGVTITGTATVAIATEVVFLVTVTGAATVTITRVSSRSAAA